MRLQIYSQLATCISALIGIFFISQETTRIVLTLKIIAAIAVISTTAFSIVLAIKAENDGNFIKKMLTNLTHSVQPSEVIAEGITQAIRRRLDFLYKFSQVYTILEQDGTTLLLCRTKESSEYEGALLIMKQNLTDLCLLDNEYLPAAIDKQLLKSWGLDTLLHDWNLIHDILVTIARLVFAEAGYHYGVQTYLESTKGYMAIAPPSPANTISSRAWAYLSNDTLNQLLKQPIVKRTLYLVRVCGELVA